MEKYDLIIIGGGPAGYAAAVSACEAGWKIAVIEKEKMGGVCVNFGCIPTKALLRFAQLRKEGQNITLSEAIARAEAIAESRSKKILELITNLGGRYVPGTVSKVEQGRVTLSTGEVLEASHILIATGSAARRLPFAEYDGQHIVTSKEALTMDTVPEKAVVVGTGATGIELATVWSRFGAEVTVLEMLPHIMGFDDDDISSEAVAAYAAQGIRIQTEVTVTGIQRDGEQAVVSYRDKEGEHTITADRVLVAAGIVPSSAGLGLEDLGMEMEKGNIRVDEEMRTNIPGIYAAGDVTGKMALAYVSSKQGKCAVASMTGHPTEPINYAMTPRCIFSAVEGAFVGLMEKQAEAAGKKVICKKVPLVSFNGNFVGEAVGIAKIVAEAETERALGVSLMGPNAADAIAAPAILISNGATLHEVADVLMSGR